MNLGICRFLVVSTLFIFFSMFMRRCGASYKNRIHICFYMMHLLFEKLVLDSDSLKIGLKYDIHRVEKEWNIEDSISHSEDLPCYSHRNKITKSDGSGSDNSKVKCIKITRSYRISCLKTMNKKSSYQPRNNEYNSYYDEFFVVEV